MRILRVFPRRTSHTPTDPMALVGYPPLPGFRPDPGEVDEVHVSSGERTRWGVVAVDPAVIGLHSQLQIEGFGGTVFEAKDRGGAIIGRMVDVWHRTDAEALRFGIREARVWRLSN